MNALHDHLGRHKALRTTALAIMFLIASVSLWLGIALCLFVPRSPQYDVWQRALPVSFFVIAAGLDFSIARLVSWFGNRNYAMAVAQSSAVVLGGTILTSIAVMRENWFETMKELAQQALAR